MKIVFVSDVIYPYVKGGAEKRISEISRRLASGGHEVHVYGQQWWEGQPVFVKDHITYHGVCQAKPLYVNGRRSITEAVWFGVCLLGPLMKADFDVIDCNEHPYFSLFSCKIACVIKRKKLFATWHEVWGSYWNEYMGVAGYAGRLIERASAWMADKIIAVSEGTAADLRALGVRGNRIAVVPNGIPLAHIKEIPASGEACDVVYAGRLIRDKHVDVLIRACAGTPYRLTVIGDGPERVALEALAAELKVPVTFTGFLEEDALIGRLKAAKVFVLPSTREGFGITVIEAMACGLPVITVDAPRNYAKDLVEDGVTGQAVPMDETSIGQAIAGMLSDESRRVRLSRSGRIAAERYDWDSVVRLLENSYKC